MGVIEKNLLDILYEEKETGRIRIDPLIAAARSVIKDTRPLLMLENIEMDEEGMVPRMVMAKFFAKNAKIFTEKRLDRVLKCLKQDKELMKNARKKKKKRKELKRVLRDHPEFELTFGMQLGIRHVLGMEAGGIATQREDTPRLEHFTETVSLDFPRAGSNKPPFTVPHQSRDFKFKTYAPKIFERIRQRFGIGTIQFITSVCGNFEYLSFMTNSKSGQFFFYSHDRRYMLKTMSPDECKLLMKILIPYYNHVMSHPNTLLCRFYGMHRVTPRWRKGFHFLIMESVFSDPARQPQQRFDLKGSRIGRQARRGESVYKDNDFVDNGFDFSFSKSTSELLRDVIAKDADFLKQNLLLDYSLLVGIWYADQREMKTIEYKQDRLRRLKDKGEKKVKKYANGVPTKYNKITNAGKKNIKMRSDAASARSSISSQPGEVVSLGSAVSPQQVEIEMTEAKSPRNARRTRRARRQSIIPHHHGGLRVYEGGKAQNIVYYVGIIDILTEWGLKKRLEHNARAVLSDPNLVSCVHPKHYGNRFADFIISRTTNLPSNSRKSSSAQRTVPISESIPEESKETSSADEKSRPAAGAGDK